MRLHRSPCDRESLFRSEPSTRYDSILALELPLMSNEHTGNENDAQTFPRRKSVPLAMARGPYEYIPGDQELPVQLTSLLDMLQWAQNWARSKSVWPLGYGLACCAIELIV